MGTLSPFLYEGDGVLRWKKISYLYEYDVSRLSTGLLMDSAEKVLGETLPGAHIYMLGANEREASSILGAANQPSKCTLVDISEQGIQTTKILLENPYPSVTIGHEVMNFQSQDLPVASNDNNRIIVYPSANIGNTRGYYAQKPIDNLLFYKQFRRFFNSANELVLVFDSCKDPEENAKKYSGDAHSDFVIKGVMSYCERFGITGLNPQALIHESFWSDPTSAQLHALIATEDMSLEAPANDEKLMLKRGATFVPAISYKFSVKDMNKVALFGGWKPKTKPVYNGSIVGLTYERA